MYEKGFKNIVNVDISKYVINMMSNWNKDKPEMSW